MLLSGLFDNSSYRRNYLAAENALKVFRAKRAASEAAGDTDRTTLLNVVQFALLFNLDLTTLLYEIERAPSQWRKQLHSRHLVLVLFESVDDCVALLGKNFRKVIEARPAGAELLPRLNALHSQLRDFQSKYHHFRELRTTLIAHRDHNAEKLLQLLDNIDVHEVDRAGGEMLAWLTTLHLLCKDAL